MRICLALGDKYGRKCVKSCGDGEGRAEVTPVKKDTRWVSVQDVLWKALQTRISQVGSVESCGKISACNRLDKKVSRVHFTRQRRGTSSPAWA